MKAKLVIKYIAIIGFILTLLFLSPFACLLLMRATEDNDHLAYYSKLDNECNLQVDLYDEGATGGYTYFAYIVNDGSDIESPGRDSLIAVFNPVGHDVADKNFECNLKDGKIFIYSPIEDIDVKKKVVSMNGKSYRLIFAKK